MLRSTNGWDISEGSTLGQLTGLNNFAEPPNINFSRPDLDFGFPNPFTEFCSQGMVCLICSHILEVIMINNC